MPGQLYMSQQHSVSEKSFFSAYFYILSQSLKPEIFIFNCCWILLQRYESLQVKRETTNIWVGPWELSYCTVGSWRIFHLLTVYFREWFFPHLKKWCLDCSARGLQLALVSLLTHNYSYKSARWQIYNFPSIFRVAHGIRRMKWSEETARATNNKPPVPPLGYDTTLPSGVFCPPLLRVSCRDPPHPLLASPSPSLVTTPPPPVTWSPLGR